MPAPTDILNDDIKDLRQSNKEIVAAIGDLKIEMTRRFGQIETEMGRRFEHLETRLDTYTGISKWVAGIMTALLVATLGSIGGAIWWASSMETRLTQVEHRIEAISPKK